MSAETAEDIVQKILKLDAKQGSLNERRRNRMLGKKLLELLPQGHGSGLNADLVDDFHVEDIIKEALRRVASIIDERILRGSGGGGAGMSKHGNEFHSPSFEEYGLSLLLDGSRKMVENAIVEKAAGKASLGTFLSGFEEEAPGIDLVNPLDTRKMRLLFTDGYPLDAYLFDAAGNMLSNPFYFDGEGLTFECEIALSGYDLFDVGKGTFNIIRIRNMEARNQDAYWKTSSIYDSFWRFQTLYGGTQTCAELVSLGPNNGVFRIQRAGNITGLAGKALDFPNFKVSGVPGVDGSFTTVDGKTVTVAKGLITSIA